VLCTHEAVGCGISLLLAEHGAEAGPRDVLRAQIVACPKLAAFIVHRRCDPFVP
jgi:hypothetical protein